MNKVIIGSYTFTDDEIMSGSIAMSHSVIGESLSADSFTFVVHSTHTGNHKLLTNSLQWYTTNNNLGFVIADSNVESIAYATSAQYYIDDVLCGQFFVSSITRTGKNLFKIICTSSIGLLINSTHMGGIYTGQTASTVIADILQGITYTLDASLQNSTIRGYLPIASKRDNLQQVLFAIGGAIKIIGNGGLTITTTSPNPVSEIEAERIYLGGNVEKGKSYSGVQLTEHNYFASGEVETLYDDTISGQQVITFNEPHYYITAVDGNGNNILVYPTSTSAGVNYCIVQSTGTSSTCTITGKKYTHVQRVISRGNVVASSNSNIMNITKAYLCNPEVADTLADRAWNYAQCNKIIKQHIVVGNERAGDIVKIMNPYTYESVQGILTSMNIQMSGLNKAETEMLVGYVPDGAVSGFQHYAMLTGNGSFAKSGDSMTLTQTSGNWVIDGNTVSGTQTLGNITKFRMILIGGGGGGANGTAGSSGGNDSTTFDRTYTYSSIGSGYRVSNINPQPGAGGNGGSGGNGGQAGGVFELSLDIANGDSGNIVIGAGGTGGANPTLGTASTLSLNGTSYSSANGKTYSYGYVEPKSGLTFAGKGTDGKDGGNGGAGSGTGNGVNGQDVDPYTGGAGSTKHTVNSGTGETWTWYYTYIYYGAGGGGASGSANGTGASNHNGGRGANGSNGANATNYGAGGNGGHGGAGGGGGSHEEYYANMRAGDWDANVYLGTGGAGGTAGTGGNGKQGCIIIYY